MKDHEKTREQLVRELSELHSQNAELKESITGNLLTALAATEISHYAESIVETIREPLLVLDAGLKIISANRNFYRTFKATPGETIGCFIYDLGNKQWDIPILRELLEEILPEKETFDDFEVTHDFQDIGHKVMLLNARQVYRKDIDARMILLAIEDITERKRLEDLLMESEERFRRLFETASDGIVLLEKREGKITHANPATEKMLGYTQKESIGNKLQDIGVLLDLGDFQTAMQDLNRSGMIKYDDVPAKTKSGQHIDTDIYLVDRARLVQCNIRDITERKRAEGALRESEALFRSLIDYMHDAMLILNWDGAILFANRTAAKIIEFERPEEFAGHNMVEYLHPDSFQKAAADLEAVKADKMGFPSEYRLRSVTGRDIWVESIGGKINFRNVSANLVCIRDITERKRAEAVLGRTEEIYRMVVDNMADVITVMDLNLRFTYVSPSVIRLRGYTAEEAMSQTMEQIMTPESLSIVARALEEELKLEASGQANPDRTRILVLEEFRKDGSTVWLENHVSMVRDNEKKLTGIISLSRDITERRNAEEKLKDTLESLRKAFGATIQVMVSAVEARDPYTAGHQLRSAGLAVAIAAEMGLPHDQVEGIRMAASIHDIGKLSIPAEILSKPAKLTNIEFSLIKEHPLKGYELLRDVESPWPLAEIVYQHHERMNGSGYPRNLKGDDILMAARILAVADVVEAMASHRPYRPALGMDAALEEIGHNRGTLYDTGVADACLRLFRERGYQLPC